MIDLDNYVNKTVEFKFNGAQLRFDLSHGLFSSFGIDSGTRLLLKIAARDPVLASARRILDEGCGVGVIGLCAAKAFPQADVVLRDRDSLAVAFAERNRLANKLRGTTAWTDPKTGEERLARPAPCAGWGLIGDGCEGGPYDFVFSNLPAKAGAPVLARFFDRLSGRQGLPLLVPGGRAGVVIVNPLADAAIDWIAHAGLATVATQRGSMHRAFILERPSETASRQNAETASRQNAETASRQNAETASRQNAETASRQNAETASRQNAETASRQNAETASRQNAETASRQNAETASRQNAETKDLSAYARGESRFRLADQSYRARGFWGLPEFDTPSFGSSVAAELVSRVLAGKVFEAYAFHDALFLEPGAGHLALWASRTLGFDRVVAASRDELALRAVEVNLSSLPERSRPEFSAIDALRVDELAPDSFDFVAESPEVVPESDWIGPAWAQADRLLRAGGLYVAYCSPTDMARLEKRRGPGWSLVGQKRKKGAIAMAWRKGR